MLARVPVLALVLASCGGPGAGKTPEDHVHDRGTCPTLVSCATSVEPRSVPGLLASYGDEGACWSTAESAASCRASCDAALVELGLGAAILLGAEAGETCPGFGWFDPEATWKGKVKVGRSTCSAVPKGQTYALSFWFDAPVPPNARLTLDLEREGRVRGECRFASDGSCTATTPRGYTLTVRPRGAVTLRYEGSGCSFTARGSVETGDAFDTGWDDTF